MKIYLASPFFTSYERARVEKVAKYFRDKGHVVFVPMEHQIPNAWALSNETWGRKVFDLDTEAIRDCDTVVTILNCGMTDDAGTCWEVGYAYALKKYIIAIIDNRLQSIMTMNAVNEVRTIDNLDESYGGYIEVK
jgi:nucleoside 2-deoxyribosyltransferase